MKDGENMDFIYSELKELYGQNDLYHDEGAAKKAAEITRELVQYGWMARKEGILSIDGEATEKDDILVVAKVA